ncbi:MAG: alpha/beta fold hydrolase [Planctomycetota bacterium]|nr:alpha/beta fold hydrolase [Planctomycetota bacterium]
MRLREVWQAGHSCGLRGVVYGVLAAAAAMQAGFHERARAASSDAPGGTAQGGLPAYEFGYKDPLYATIAGYLSIKDIELKNQKSYKLKVVDFRKEAPVRAILQPQEAPLVVVLLGIDGKSDSPLGRLWASWYAEAGNHVLTFDSTFLPRFIEISGRGVTGNLMSESECVRDIIAAFLEHEDVKGKVSKIGIVGMSYGALEALRLGELSAAGKLPFKVEAIQAYSPPIRLQKTGELIDQWHNEDRWNYTLVQLAGKLAGHTPVPPDQLVPFSDSLMRAGIAAAFRLTLVDVIVRNDKTYKLRMLPSGNQFDDEYVKQDYAAAWGYGKFMDDMCFPYWERKAGFKSLSDLTDPIQLPTLLQKQPPCSELILAEDDPFDLPEDVAELKKAAANKRAVFLPRGGHLGYVNEPWTKAKLLTLFKSPAPQTAVSQPGK